MDKMGTMLAMCLGFLLVLGHRLAVEACSCMPAHPQQHFCTASFVIKATIVKREPRSSSPGGRVTHYMYQAKIDRVFKGEGLKEGMNVEISTPSFQSMCGNLNLRNDTKYVLTGQKYHDQMYHNLCNMAIEWLQVTPFQRQGFRNFYKKSCSNCEISTPYNAYMKSIPADKQCDYDPFMEDELDCESKYSTCIKQSKGPCNWLPTSTYEECVLQRQLATGASGSGSQFSSEFLLAYG